MQIPRTIRLLQFSVFIHTSISSILLWPTRARTSNQRQLIGSKQLQEHATLGKMIGTRTDCKYRISTLLIRSTWTSTYFYLPTLWVYLIIHYVHCLILFHHITRTGALNLHNPTQYRFSMFAQTQSWSRDCRFFLYPWPCRWTVDPVVPKKKVDDDRSSLQLGNANASRNSLRVF